MNNNTFNIVEVNYSISELKYSPEYTLYTGLTLKAADILSSEINSSILHPLYHNGERVLNYVVKPNHLDINSLFSTREVLS